MFGNFAWYDTATLVVILLIYSIYEVKQIICYLAKHTIFKIPVLEQKWLLWLNCINPNTLMALLRSSQLDIRQGYSKMFQLYKWVFSSILHFARIHQDIDRKMRRKYISGVIELLHMLYCHYLCIQHDGVIKWKHFSRYWPFVSGIHRSPVDSPHKGQWHGTVISFFDLRLDKRLSKHSRNRWFETPSRSSWRHCNDDTVCRNYKSGWQTALSQPTKLSCIWAISMSVSTTTQWHSKPSGTVCMPPWWIPCTVDWTTLQNPSGMMWGLRMIRTGRMIGWISLPTGRRLSGCQICRIHGLLMTLQVPCGIIVTQ